MQWGELYMFLGLMVVGRAVNVTLNAMIYFCFTATCPSHPPHNFHHVFCFFLNLLFCFFLSVYFPPNPLPRLLLPSIYKVKQALYQVLRKNRSLYPPAAAHTLPQTSTTSLSMAPATSRPTALCLSLGTQSPSPSRDSFSTVPKHQCVVSKPRSRRRWGEGRQPAPQQ